MRRAVRLLLLLVLSACGSAACGACQHPATPAAPSSSARAGAAALSLDLSETRPVGLTPGFRPSSRNAQVARGAAIGSLRCQARRAIGYGAHLEIFAENRGVVVPAGIGIADPQRRRGPFVLGGRCAYPLQTRDPTGVIEVSAPATPTLGQLFAVWGQPLSAQRLAGFTGRVFAFVDGRRWSGDPRAIPLARHAQVVLELGPFIPPHRSYVFPPGL